MKIAPSILSADFGKLNEEIASIEGFSDILHIDVMDGHFVPNISFGAPVVRCIRTKLPLDVHLMIENPENFIEDFAKAIKEATSDYAGSYITFHSEAVKDAEVLIQKIHNLGLKAGVSIKPKTPINNIKDILEVVDLVLVMTVEPGFGGQAFIPEMVEKIKELRNLSENLEIAVDGGINGETAKIVVAVGANILIAGSYIFGSMERKKTILSLGKELVA